MKRGIATVEDLRARSERRPGSDCWWWLGAMACDKVSPRIWTLDYELVDKRTMTGPQAVWNISRGEGLHGWLAYMRCVNSSCVNPVHVGKARSRVEIGAHIARHGKRKGRNTEAQRGNIRKAWQAAGITPTAPEVVAAIRAEPSSLTNIALAAKYGLGHTTVSRIRRGDSHRGAAA